MGLVDKKLLKKRIGLDASMLIDFMTAETKRQKELSYLLGNAKHIIGSYVLLAESTVRFWKDKNKRMIEIVEGIPHVIENFEYVNFGENEARYTAYLRSQYRWLKTPDAMHVATAITQECDYFLTCDKKLKKVKEIPVVVL
jgi:predicted nucleic acid-binding protein